MAHLRAADRARPRAALCVVLVAAGCAALPSPAAAVTARIAGGALDVEGDDSAERIVVGQRTIAGVRVLSVDATDGGGERRLEIARGSGCLAALPDGTGERGAAYCSAVGVRRIRLAGRRGGDRLEIEPRRPGFERVAVPVRVEGGGGGDTIEVDAGPAVALGGPGADRIGRRCGRGAAMLSGGAGADVVSACDSGTPERAGGPAKRLEGGRGDDSLAGGAGADRLAGGPGIDGLSGAGGRDRLAGGPGADTLFGGRGRDWLDGGRGDDSFATRDKSADRAAGGPGRDSALADSADVLVGMESVFRLPFAR